MAFRTAVIVSQYSYHQHTDIADHDAFQLIHLAANFLDAICC